MNKFMAGLTLGIVATACFFIFVDPFQKKAFIPPPFNGERVIDTLQKMTTVIKQDSVTTPFLTEFKKNGTINRDSLVLFAKSLLGTPYLYGGADPASGFDCSGFITYVFNHFKFAVPRSSYEFEDIGAKRSFKTCRPGDVILFTGTDPLERTIGHIGIISDVAGGVPSFIHSSSGKANGVTLTSMDNKFYQQRFIAVMDVLFQK